MAYARTSTATLAVLACITATATADRVLIGTQHGTVIELDTDTGGTRFRGVCGGPITAMASVGDSLYLGDTFGTVYIFDLTTDFVTGAFTSGIDIRAIAADEQHVFVGGAGGELQQFEPGTNNAVGSTTFAWTDISAMTIVGGDLFTGGLSTVAQRAPVGSALDQGAHSFVAACQAPIQSMAVDGGTVFLGGTNGAIYRYALADGTLDGYYQTTVDAAALLGLGGGRMLIADSAGTLLLADPVAGTVLTQFDVGVPIGGMLLIDTPDCPADLDGSGSADIDDVLAFLDAVVAGDPVADLDASGEIDVDDLIAFVDAFVAGCG